MLKLLACNQVNSCTEYHVAVLRQMSQRISENSVLITFLQRSNNLRKNICFRKSDGSAEENLVFNDIESLVEHGIPCLLCSYINVVINMLA